jgi:hypothetical protein
MPHTCSSCSRPVFSHGYCKYHQYMRKMKGGDLYNKTQEARTPKKAYKVPPVSKKRSEEQKYYAQGCKELTAELREQNNGKIYCFFTGQEITGFVTYHHLLGRTGDFYTDKSLLVPCGNDVHLEYHRSTVEQLRNTSWYAGFLERLRLKSKDAYNKEIRKSEKELNFDEDNLEITKE